VLLSGASRLDDAEAMRTAMREATDQLGRDIEALRGLIAELRPAALDQLGLQPALVSLAQRTATTTGLDVQTAIELAGERRLAPELETTVYRIVQEALTNVAKHARATTVWVTAREAGSELQIGVTDDGTGFDPNRALDAGFGLVGMRERVELAGGALSVAPADGAGTAVRATLPLR
jgi:signal transduction histidine kinase